MVRKTGVRAERHEDDGSNDDDDDDGDVNVDGVDDAFDSAPAACTTERGKRRLVLMNEPAMGMFRARRRSSSGGSGQGSAARR